MEDTCRVRPGRRPRDAARNGPHRRQLPAYSAL